MVMARIREEIDYITIIRKEDKLVIIGLLLEIERPADKMELKNGCKALCGLRLTFFSLNPIKGSNLSSPGLMSRGSQLCGKSR